MPFGDLTSRRAFFAIQLGISLRQISAPKRKIVVRKYAIFPRESPESYDTDNYSKNQFFEMLYLSVNRVATPIMSMSDILWLQSGVLSCDRFQ